MFGILLSLVIKSKSEAHIVMLKVRYTGPASMTELVGVSSHNQKIVGSIPGQGTYLDCRFDSQSKCFWSPVQACTRGNQLIHLSHINVSLFSFLSPFPSL